MFRQSQKLAATAFAGAIVASTVAMPSASAEPILGVTINDMHTAAGCAPLNSSGPLSTTAIDYARNMAENDGQVHPPSGTMTFSLSTEDILNGKGYYPNGNYWEMDYFNPNGASNQDAIDFWVSHGLRDGIVNCGYTDMGWATWVPASGKNKGKMAATVLLATPGAPPGELPAGDQPH